MGQDWTRAGLVNARVCKRKSHMPRNVERKAFNHTSSFVIPSGHSHYARSRSDSGSGYDRTLNIAVLGKVFTGMENIRCYLNIRLHCRYSLLLKIFDIIEDIHRYSIFSSIENIRCYGKHYACSENIRWFGRYSMSLKIFAVIQYIRCFWQCSMVWRTSLLKLLKMFADISEIHYYKDLLLGFNDDGFKHVLKYPNTQMWRIKTSSLWAVLETTFPTWNYLNNNLKIGVVYRLQFASYQLFDIGGGRALLFDRGVEINRYIDQFMLQKLIR